METPDELNRMPPENVIGTVGMYLFLISAAMVMNACSTLVAFFALVSRKGIPISSANACHIHGINSALPTLTRSEVPTNQHDKQVGVFGHTTEWKCGLPACVFSLTYVSGKVNRFVTS